jgi:hypothetical protein
MAEPNTASEAPEAIERRTMILVPTAQEAEGRSAAQPEEPGSDTAAHLAGAGAAPVQPQVREDKESQACTVEAVRKGSSDGRGETIERIFFRRDEYAIYLANGTVTVQFSNCTNKASAQIRAIAELLPLRNKLQYLGRGLTTRRTTSGSATEADGNPCYFSQIADAMRLGLENQLPMGRSILEGAIADLTALVERDGRVCYLKAGVLTMLGFMFASLVGVVVSLWSGSDFFSKMFAASCSGAIGAMLSIALGIRNRTVAVDGYARSNRMEAALRVLIGVISGVVLYLVLSSGLVTGMDSMLKPAEFGAWKMTILIGFMGGFLERLVPDLLEKTGTRVSGGGTGSSGTQASA